MSASSLSTQFTIHIQNIAQNPVWTIEIRHLVVKYVHVNFKDSRTLYKKNAPEKHVLNTNVQYWKNAQAYWWSSFIGEHGWGD